MRPYVSSSLPPSADILSRHYKKQGVWELALPSDQMCPSDLTGQGDYFWLDHVQTRPAFLHNLFSSHWISSLQNIFILFLFIEERVQYISSQFLSLWIRWWLKYKLIILRQN